MPRYRKSVWAAAKTVEDTVCEEATCMLSKGGFIMVHCVGSIDLLLDLGVLVTGVGCQFSTMCM